MLALNYGDLRIIKTFGHNHDRGFITIHYHIRHSDGRVFENFAKTGGTNEDADRSALLKVALAVRDGEHIAVKQIA